MWTNLISFWDDLVDPLQVTFDGDNKLIIVNPIPLFANGTPKGTVSQVKLKEDVYSASKRWLARRQNLQYGPPIRAIGGDVVPGGLYAGDIYFLKDYPSGTNSPGNWRFYIDHQVELIGPIYNDNTATLPFIVTTGGGVISTTSALAYAYTGTGATVPTAQDISNQVWSTNPVTYGPTTAAGVIKNTNQTVANIQTTTENIFAVSI